MEKCITFDQNPQLKSEVRLHITEKDENGFLEICLSKGKTELKMFLDDSEIRDVLEALVRFL